MLCLRNTGCADHTELSHRRILHPLPANHILHLWIHEEISYPVILKASAGERGKGMRTVRDSDKLEDAFNITRYEASNAFGSNDIYIEKRL